MRFSFFILTAALVVATKQAQAAPTASQSHIDGRIRKQVGDLEYKVEKQFGGVSEEFNAIGKQLGEAKSSLDRLAKSEAATKEAVAQCGKDETLADRLRKCVNLMVAARKLNKQVAEQKKTLGLLSKQMEGLTSELRAKDEAHDKTLADHARALEEEAVERRTEDVRVDKMLNKHTGRLDRMDDRLGDVKRDIADLGGPTQFISFAGLWVHRSGIAVGPGIGLSLAGAGGAVRVEPEVMVGVGPEMLGVSGSIRLRPVWEEWWWIGGNGRFIVEGDVSLKYTRNLAVVVGPSFGFLIDRFGLTIDTFVIGGRRNKDGFKYDVGAAAIAALKF